MEKRGNQLDSKEVLFNSCLRMTVPLYSIQSVANRTGLSTHVIRIWEKRYRAVEPARTGTNRRLYSESNIERLGLLKDLTAAGHSISQIAQLTTEDLRNLLAGSPKTKPGENKQENAGNPQSHFLEESIAAIKNLDARGLEIVLKKAAVEFGAQGVLMKLIAPLAKEIGDLWRDGTITAAHEHFASAVIRIFLGHAAKTFCGTDHAPVLVVATPSGQLHELGALLVGAAAANVGWHVTYLGASLPAAEIAGAARQNRARAVALSIVYPLDDPKLDGELNRLRELLPSETILLAGGRGMPSYHSTLQSIGALQIKDLSHLCNELDNIRQPANP